MPATSYRIGQKIKFRSIKGGVREATVEAIKLGEINPYLTVNVKGDLDEQGKKRMIVISLTQIVD